MFTAARKGRARIKTTTARCLASFLTYAPCFCPFSHSPSSGALGNTPRQVRHVGDEVTKTARLGSSARHATPSAASSAEPGAVPFSARRKKQTPPPPPARLSSSLSGQLTFTGPNRPSHCGGGTFHPHFSGRCRRGTQVKFAKLAA